MASALSLSVYSNLESTSEPLSAVYVGETIVLCLKIPGYPYSNHDGLMVTLEKFCVAESRRLYSDSTTNIERMRSVDSLLSDGGHAHLQPSQSHTKGHRGWSCKFSDGNMTCNLPFTPQPMSDDSINLQCKFVVSVRQRVVEKAQTPVNMDPFVLDFIKRELGGVSETTVRIADLGVIELPITLMNPIKVTRRMSPITSKSCSFFVDIESNEEDTIVDKLALQIRPACSPIQTGTVIDQKFTCSVNDSIFPFHIGALGDSIELHVNRKEHSVAERYRSQLVLHVTTDSKRKCILSFDSPFDPQEAFLPPSADNFTVEFSCEETTIKINESIRVRVMIKNRTDQTVNLSLKFPLVDKQLQQKEFQISDPTNVTADDLLQIIRAQLSTYPGFVCKETERNLGPIHPFTMYSTYFEYEAIMLGRQHIPTVILVDNDSGKTVEFNKFLELTVTL